LSQDTPRQDTPQPARSLSRRRRALLGVYATIDPKLRAELRSVGVEFDEELNPFVRLQQAADEPDEPGRPGPHPLHLAFAAMRVARTGAGPPRVRRDNLRRVAARLLDPETPPGEQEIAAADAVAAALERAAGPDVVEEDRWTQVVQAVGEQLRPELRIIREAWCRPSLRQVGDEVVSRIETRVVVDDQRSLDELTPAVVPDNWKHCNDFFCDLIRRPERDAGCPGATGGDLTASVDHWRGVYEERVGDCPGGWFPDTFLLFTWARTERQLILGYELAPRRRRDRTVLRVDQGYIQVDRLPDVYQVSTLKYLLFDDRRISGGGQTLAQAACQLGWLDCSINQFTVCATDLASSGRTPTVTAPPGGTGLDDELQAVLDRCQAHLLETASDADAQLGRALAKVRDGSYSLDEYVGDLGELVARGVRDGARSVRDQLDLLLSATDVVRTMARRRGGGT
jgi:hypothetical protein